MKHLKYLLTGAVIIAAVICVLCIIAVFPQILLGALLLILCYALGYTIFDKTPRSDWP